VALRLCRNVDFMNSLIAVLPQSCAARKKRMHSQSLKAQLRMIAAHYRTLPQLAFEDSSLAAGFEKNDQEHSESRETSVDFFEDEGDATPNVRGWRSQR
jgi:hypothetical protein